MADRYFLDSPPVNDAALLSGSEAHHLAHVMRRRPGDTVVLFDGSGAQYSARVEQIARAEVRLSVLSRQEIDCELARNLELGVALPKGDRQRWLVEKAVELGVKRFVPLVTQHGVAQPSGAALVRLERSVIEASKQCGRNRLMQIAQPQSLSEYAGPSADDAVKLLAHPGGASLRAALKPAQAAGGPKGVRIAIGPEGGFADDEVALASAQGWQVVSLGSRIMRIETAALFLSAVVAAQFSDST